MGNSVSSGVAPSPFAAVFLDFENVYYFLKNEFADPPELNDHVLEILRNLRNHLLAEWGLDSIILNAYADFERLDAAPQGALYLLGVDTKNVLGTDHKNAADMRLCIDVLEVLYTRREIDTFVLVAGDRDYIPVIQHLRRQAKRVLGVGFRESVSGDLLLNLGDKQFIDARDLLDPATLERLEDRRREFLERQADREARFAEAARARDHKALLAMQAAQAEQQATRDAIEASHLEANGTEANGIEADGTDGANANGSEANGSEASVAPDFTAEDTPEFLTETALPLAPQPGEVRFDVEAPLSLPLMPSALPPSLTPLLGDPEALPAPPATANQNGRQAAATAARARELFSDEGFDPIGRIEDDDALVCLGLILTKLRQLQKTRDTNEIWLGPFLRHLTDEMPALADFERRMLLDVLSRSGAIRIEKRDGEPYPYSVVLVNYQHPDVWDLNPG
jgi:hypothetical protein